MHILSLEPRDLVFLFAALGAGVACGVQSYIAATFGTLLFCAIAMQASLFGIRRKYDGLVRFQIPVGPALAARVTEIMQAIPRAFAGHHAWTRFGVQRVRHLL